MTTVLRIRNHPSIGLYCGRNEGFPPKPLDDGIRKVCWPSCIRASTTSPSSADNVVGGGGPYMRHAARASISRMARIPKAAQRNRHAQHPLARKRARDDARRCSLAPGTRMGTARFRWRARRAAQAFCDIDRTGLRRRRQCSKNGFRWRSSSTTKAIRAEFEAQSKYRMGLLLWMSHPAGPRSCGKPTITTWNRRRPTSPARKLASRCTSNGIA